MKKYLTISIFVSIVSTNLYCDMKDFANGVIEVYNPAKKISSKDRTLLYGGGYTLKVPNVKLTPFSIQAPKINAGCGGIDLTFGSLSFLSKDQFVKFVEGIMSASPGVAFDLALKTLCPSCAETLKSLENMANQINSMSLDSCSTATALGNLADDALTNSGIKDELSNNSVNSWLEGTVTPSLKKADKYLQKTNNWLNNTFTGGINGNSPKILKFIIQDADRSFMDYFFKNVMYYNDSSIKTFLKSTVGDIYVATLANGQNLGRLEFKTSLSPLESYYLANNNNEITNSEKLINRLIGTSTAGDGVVYTTSSYNVSTITNGNFPKGGLIGKYKTIVDGILDNISNRTQLTQNQINFLGYFNFPVYRIFNVLGGNPYTLEILISSKEKLSIMLATQLVYEMLSTTNRIIQMRVNELNAYYEETKTIPVQQALPDSQKNSPLKKQLEKMAKESRLVAGLSYKIYAKAYDDFLKSLNNKNDLIQQAKRLKQLAISRTNPKMLDKLLYVEAMTPKINQ